MDLSKLSDSDLMALQANDLSRVSDQGLNHLQNITSTYTGDVPTKSTKVYQEPKPKGFLDKTAEVISGGKFGSMQDFLYGGETPESTALGRTGQILHQSGIEGLTGIGPLGQTGSVVTAIGQNIPTVASLATKASEKAPAAAKVAQTVGNKLANALTSVKEMPTRYLSYQSKVPVQDIKAAYQIGKQQEPAVVEKFKDVLEATDLQPIGQYKYARRFGLPPEEASKVTRMGYEDDQAFWNVLNDYLGKGNKPFPFLSPSTEFSKLSEADKIRYAEDVAMNLGSVKPTTKAGRILGGAEGGLAALETQSLFPAIAKSLGGIKFAPLLALHAASKSPYLVGRTAYGAGKAANVIEPLMATKVPVNQTAALLARLLSNQEEQ